jgi:hypothetical protein
MQNTECKPIRLLLDQGAVYLHKVGYFIQNKNPY